MKLTATLRIALYALAGLAAVWAFVHFVSGPRKAREEAAQSKASAVAAEASKAAAQDTIKIIVDREAVHDSIDVTTSENQRAIKKAPGAADAVGAGVHNAGLRALCLRPTYHLQPACQRLLDPDTGDAAE